MKNQVFLLLCLTACLLQVYGQTTTDKQWLILNGVGKIGIGSNGLNNYPSANSIQTGFFVLENVHHPIRTMLNPNAKNDLFVIYSDWSYFSTREKVLPYQASIDIFYPHAGPPQQSTNDIIHNFSTPSPIRYMYLSNIYEGNDPPPDLRVKMGDNGTNELKYSLSTTPQNDIITANHNVIKDADITLIIKKNSLKNETLFFNKVKNNISGAEDPGIFFEPSNIFLSNGLYTCSNVPYTDNHDGSLTFGNFNLPTDYVFVNLKPTAALPDYYPNDPDLNKSAIFTIGLPGGGGTPILTENILLSHDPNFIQVISTCKNEKSGTYIFYHVEFYNEGNLSADNLAIQLSLPDYLDKNCIRVEKWIAGGKSTSGTLDIGNNGEIIFTFDPMAQVQAFQPDNMKNCTGYIEFCVKFKNNQTSEVSKSHKPFKSFVSFGPDSYPITDFRPIRNSEIPGPYVKFPNNRRGCSCKCSRTQN